MALKAVKAKTCADLVQKTNAALEKVNVESQKSLDECAKHLAAMRLMLYGTKGAEASPEHRTQIAAEVYKTRTMHLLVEKLDIVDFEAKKDLVHIFNKLVRREIGLRHPTVEWMLQPPNQVILHNLVKGYNKLQVDALNCGLMLRECIKSEQLAKIILYDNSLFDAFFNYVQYQSFDIAADAFSTLKDLLTKHKILCADFLEKNYDSVMEKYRGLLDSTNYVTRRQSLKLLGELLLDRANFTIMTKYIGDPENLQLMMNMLRDKSKNIQFEAFHVFKVFVANPNKSGAIMSILLKNQQKLIQFLQKFHESRSDDEQFAEEKAYLIKQIKELR